MPKKEFINSENAMYLEMFEENSILADLVQRRGELQKEKSMVHKNIYNNTTDIKESEEKLSCIVKKLKEKIKV